MAAKVAMRGGRATVWPWTRFAIPFLRWHVELTISRRRPLPAPAESLPRRVDDFWFAVGGVIIIGLIILGTVNGA